MSDHAERLFEQALELDPASRSGFVHDASPQDAQLRDELLSLLDESEAANDFFDRLGEAVFSDSYSIAADENSTLPTDDPDLAEGSIVRHYRIIALIGRGGMGTVYRAHDTRLDRDVALKFLRHSPHAASDARERLMTEARAVAALDHLNVCSVHEIGETEAGRLYIAMPWYEGETLKERLRLGALSLEDSVSTASQIARAMIAAHSRGIVHRDVKPGNIILGLDGTVRLLDFGLATASETTLSGSSVTRGTVSYMSPEQLRGEALDTRTDLWSLGVVMYEMLTGVRPFRGAGANAVRNAILGDAPEPFSSSTETISPSLTRIVDRLLQKERTLRYSTAAEVLGDLERVSASPSGSRQLAFISARRAGIAGISVVLAFAAILGWRRLHDQSFVAATKAQEPSIAVLPLVNFSPDSADAVLADGMTEELIATLASASDVRVIASTSVAVFKGKDMDVRKIADSLGVSSILEGGLQKSGSRVRLHLRLVNGQDGVTRWSQSYDREFKDMFAMQADIARAVAGELELRFDKDRQFVGHHPRNLIAYELYLRGWDPVLLRSPGGVIKAQEYFQRAIAADSMYAAAHAGLALAYMRRASATTDRGISAPNFIDMAEVEARKAVALDDSLAEAHNALGRVFEATLRLPAAEASIRRAIALDPTRSLYRRSLSYILAWDSHPEEELAEARRVLETDPLNPYSIIAVADGLFATRRYDEALAQLRVVTTITPPIQHATLTMAEIYAKKHMWAKAVATLRGPGQAGDPGFVAWYGYMLARAGQRAEANRILADLVAQQRQAPGSAFDIATVYAGLGDFDQAFAWLNKAIDDGSIDSVIMGPMFDDIHRDPRFALLRGRLHVRQLTQ